MKAVPGAVNLDHLRVRRCGSIPVARLMDHFPEELRLVGGHQGIGRRLYTADLNRPGLALSGYLEYFSSDRVQVLGNTEVHYMERLAPAQLEFRLERMFSFEIPAFMCNQPGIPVLTTHLSTDELISRIIVFLSEEFAPSTEIHATAVDCYGVGVMMLGTPGVGKSEVALELVERGHLLIADDSVRLKRIREDTLMASSSIQIEHHMEIRGVGIIDVKSMFGVMRVSNQKPISLVVELEEWRSDVDYDRTGLGEEYVELLNVRVPFIRVPVRPGRNIAIIVEVAALNHRLKEMGINPAELLNRRILSLMNEGYQG
mgnify:CR=1 FL=1